MGTVLNKILIVLLLAALSAVGVQSIRVTKAQNQAVAASDKAREYKRSLESLQASLAALNESTKRAASITEKRNVRAETLAVKAEKDNHALSEAIVANPSWASQPIPIGLLDQLSD